MTQTYHKITYLSKLSIALLIVISVLYLILNYIKDDVPAKNSTVNSKAQVTVTDSVFSSTGDNSYKIVAKQVTQSDDGIYFLNTIAGAYHLDNSEEINIKAHSGRFDSILDVAQLENDVKITYLGYDLISDMLDLDLKHYSASSTTNVHIKGIGGSIDAESFKTTDKFNQITFHGNVKADFIINHKR
jgi:LPS export ABC transporter protein LptC